MRSRGFDVGVGGPLYSDAMGDEGTLEGTYIGMVRHNADGEPGEHIRERSRDVRRTQQLEVSAKHQLRFITRTRAPAEVMAGGSVAYDQKPRAWRRQR